MIYIAQLDCPFSVSFLGINTIRLVLLVLNFAGTRLFYPQHFYYNAEIGRLTKLAYLRLSHNVITGMVPDFSNLQFLNLIQLNGNRISCSIPELKIHSDDSSFVADCGSPSEFKIL